MTHRGAVGSDARDGDGAGVMTSIPHRFFIKNFERETGYKLPPQGQYAAGNLFFKPDTDILKDSTTTFEEIAESLDLRVLGWREVPSDLPMDMEMSRKLWTQRNSMRNILNGSCTYFGSGRHTLSVYTIGFTCAL